MIRGVIVVYEQVYLLCFFLYIFLFCKGFSLFGIPFIKLQNSILCSEN